MLATDGGGEAHKMEVSFRGQMLGVGRPTGAGFKSSWGAAGSVQMSSEKLARLNSVATVVEYEVEEDGSYRWTLWEWKGAVG